MLNILHRNHDFRNFFFGQVISQLGDRIHSLALLWITYHWSGSAAAVGGIMVATTLPGVLIAPLAGSLCDRKDKKYLLITADLVRAGLVLLLAVAAYRGFLNYPLLIAATVVISLAAAFFNPAALSLLPNLVPAKELTQANAMNQLSASGSAVLGPLFGSLLIAAIGVPAAFLCNGISFILSLSFISGIKKRPALNRHQDMLSDLKQGIALIGNTPLVKKLLGPIVVVNFFFSAVVIVIPVLAEGVFNQGARGIGTMMSAFGGGMLAGTLLLTLKDRLPGRRSLLMGGFFLMGSAFFAMGLMPHYFVSLAALFLAGICLNVINILLIVLYQTILGDEVRGKVMALITATALSLQPIAYGVTGFVLEALSPATVLLISGGIIVSAGGYIAFCRELKSSL
jgi:MFS family permease